MSRTWRPLAVCSLLGLAAAAGGCFRSPDMGKLSCTTSARCPSGWTCVVPTGQLTGICRQADSGVPDLAEVVDMAEGIDRASLPDSPSSVDASYPIADGPVPGLDGAASVDLAWPIDTPSLLDAVPDLPLAPDVPLDTTPPSDGPVTVLDSAPDAALDLPPDSLADLAPPAPDLGPDLPPGKPLGAACTLASECVDGFCVGDVCCNRACTGGCEECTAASAGRCVPKSSATRCSAQSCVGNTLYHAAYCDNGACPSPTTTTCAYGCSGTACEALKPNGTACAASSECQSGGCVWQQSAGAYVCGSCGASGAACCMIDECRTGLYCADLTSCQPQRSLGDACSTSEECASGFCSMAGVCVTSCGLKGDGCCSGGDCSAANLYCVRPPSMGWFCLPCGARGSWCCEAPSQACDAGMACNSETNVCE